MNDKKISKIVDGHLCALLEIGIESIDTTKDCQVDIYSTKGDPSYTDKFTAYNHPEFYIGGINFESTYVYTNDNHNYDVDLVMSTADACADPKTYAKVIHFGLSSNTIISLKDRFFRIENVKFINYNFMHLRISLAEVVEEEIKEVSGLKVYKSFNK